jgi:hypothetical protein
MDNLGERLVQLSEENQQLKKESRSSETILMNNNDSLRSRVKDLEDSIKHAKENNPYPEDVFNSEVGKAAKCGYDACLYNIRNFLDEKKGVE